MPCRANTADRVLCKGPYGRSAAETRRSLPRPSHSKDASTRRLGAIDSRRVIMVVFLRVVASGEWRVVSELNGKRRLPRHLLLFTRNSQLATRNYQAGQFARGTAGPTERPAWSRQVRLPWRPNPRLQQAGGSLQERRPEPR